MANPFSTSSPSDIFLSCLVMFLKISMASNSVLKGPKIQGHMLKSRLPLGVVHPPMLHFQRSVSPAAASFGSAKARTEGLPSVGKFRPRPRHTVSCSGNASPNGGLWRRTAQNRLFSLSLGSSVASPPQDKPGTRATGLAIYP